MRLIAPPPFALCCVLVIAACGGAVTPEPETPESEVGGDDKASEERSESASPAGSIDSEDSAQSSDSSSSSSSASDPTTDPKSVLIREGTAFMLNHRDSDIGQKADEQCAKKSGDDVAKKANCLSAAINKMDREGILFDQDDEGAWWYVRFGIVKGAKAEFNRVQIEVGEPSGKNITIKTTGADKAARRKGKVAGELKFEVPDEYTVILHDEGRGKLIYEPKMGLFSE
jgi:hypothetical protein